MKAGNGAAPRYGLDDTEEQPPLRLLVLFDDYFSRQRLARSIETALAQIDSGAWRFVHSPQRAADHANDFVVILVCMHVSKARRAA
jgi:hypothetical protein